MPAINLSHTAASSSSALQVPRAIKGIGSLAKHLISRVSLPASAPQTLETHSLQARQGTVAIPTVYAGLNSGPSPGTVVGATLGAVAGFLVLVWLFSTLSNRRNGGVVVDEEIIERSPRRRRRSEMRSVSRASRPERVIRTERIVRDSSRAPPPMPRSSFVVDDRAERRVEGDDVVEVIEEHSSVAPRRKTRRSSGYRSVEPDLYAGGNYPQRPVYYE